MLTIEPPPLSRIAGAQCFMPSIAPVRFTASVRFQASRVVAAIPCRAIVPALLMRMCSPPYSRCAAATASIQLFSSATSCSRKSALAPLFSSRARSAAPAAASTSVRTRSAPSPAKSSASAVPWPPAAPVINATLPASLGIASSIKSFCDGFGNGFEGGNRSDDLARRDRVRRDAGDRLGEGFEVGAHRIPIRKTHLLRLGAAAAEDQLVAPARLSRAAAPEGVHAPECRRRAHRRQNAADAAFEFEQYGERVVRIGRRLQGDQLCLDPPHRPGKADERI